MAEPPDATSCKTLPELAAYIELLRQEDVEEHEQQDDEMSLLDSRLRSLETFLGIDYGADCQHHYQKPAELTGASPSPGARSAPDQCAPGPFNTGARDGTDTD